MDKNKKALIIGGSAGAAALVTLIVVSIVLANRPSALIARAFANTISDAKRIELFDVADDVVNGGSVSVSADLSKLAKDDLYVQGKVYLDAKNTKGAYEMTVFEDNEKILQGSILYNQDKAALKCPEILDGTYGINLKNLKKNLPGSIFDPDEETEYSLDDDQFAYFMNLHETVKNDKNLEDDISKMSAKYRQLFIEKLIKYSSVSRASKTITAGGEKIPCTVVSVKVDEEALNSIAESLIDYANNDKDLEKLLFRVASNGALNEEPDEYIDKFFDNLDDIGDMIEEMGDEDVEFQFDFYITKSGRRLAQLDAELEYENEDVKVSLILGKDISRSKEISLIAKEKRTEETFEIVYTVNEDSSKAYEAEIKIGTENKRSSSRGSDITKIKIEWDRRKGDFSLKYTDKHDNIVLKASLLEKGDSYVFVLMNIREGGDAVPDVKSLGLTVIIDRHDAAPGIPGNYTEITKMDKREFKHFTEDIEDGLKELWDEYFE